MICGSLRWGKQKSSLEGYDSDYGLIVGRVHERLDGKLTLEVAVASTHVICRANAVTGAGVRTFSLEV